MRLAFCLFKYFPYGGLERDFLRIATLCQTRGYEVTVFTQAWQGDIPVGFKVRALPVRRKSNHDKAHIFAQLAMAELEVGQFDVVIGFNKMPGLDLYYAADPCYRAHKRAQFAGLYRFTPRYRIYEALENAVFSAQSRTEILLLSAPFQGIFSHYYQTPSERFHLLPPNIAKDRIAPADADRIRADFRREFGLTAEENLLLLIGSGFRRKGLDRALRAMAALPPELLRKTHLMVIGQDDPRPYALMAKRLKLTEHITLLGGRDDVPRFLLGADLLIHPAREEVTGTVLLEAVVAGLPVLVTEVCGYAFHINQAGAGCVISEPFSQRQFDRQLRDMLTSPERAQWRSNAIAYAKSHDLYSMPETVVSLIEARSTQ